MTTVINKSSGRGPWLSKTDELTQLIAESSSQTVLNFPILSHSGPLASWLRGNELVVGSISFLSRHELLLLLFLRPRKEGEQAFMPDRNLKSSPQEYMP